MKRMTHSAIFVSAGMLLLFFLLIGCANFGLGAVYTASTAPEIGGYISGDRNSNEVYVNYMFNPEEFNIQSLGAGYSFRFPLHILDISIFPLAKPGHCSPGPWGKPCFPGSCFIFT